MALGGAAGRLELRLDPVDGLPVAAGALPAVAELRQAPDDGLVALQIEPADERRDRVVRTARILPAGDEAPRAGAWNQEQNEDCRGYCRTHQLLA